MCSEIRKAAVKNQQEFDNGSKKLVGVNTLVDDNDIQLRAFQVLQEHADFEALTEYSGSLAEKQIKRLNKVRNERDNAKLDRAREKLTQTMAKQENMIPALIDAVKCGLTRGEFAGIKAEVYNLPGEGPYVCSPPHVLA
jgi:methylmalonyl-CoA mutase N-terminal domain/subunit